MSVTVMLREKHGERIIEGRDLPAVALHVVSQRLADGYWYDDWNDGKPAHQWWERAQALVEAGDAVAAERFFKDREDHEYEGWEIIPVQLAEVDETVPEEPTETLTLDDAAEVPPSNDKQVVLLLSEPMARFVRLQVEQGGSDPSHVQVSDADAAQFIDEIIGSIDAQLEN
jgi:hypothetical protein